MFKFVMQSLVIIVLVIVIYLPHEASAQQEDTATVKVSITDQQASIMQSQIDTLQKKIDALNENQSIIQESLSSMDNNASELNNGLRNLASQFISNRHSSVIGAILILLGLMIEIMGAVFLASETLTKKLVLVRNLNPRPSSKDIGLEDISIRDVTGFFATLGVVVLFAGFIIQAIGTLMVLSLTIWWWFGIGASMIATAGLTVYFVAGRCLEQTGSEKVRILIRSVYYSFVKPWTFRLWFGVLCDYCRNPIFKRNICVAFDFPDNSKEHLYLNNPHDFIIGHKKCLLKYQSDELKTMNTAEQERDYKASQKLQDLDEFSIWSNSMIPWHAKWRVHWAERRQKDLGDGSWYSELIHVRNRLGINQSFEASSNKHNLP